MKLFNDKPDYIRLDDDVSFQLARTNPVLTTNTKLMYDGENLYMEAYPAAPLLTTLNYKHHRVWKSGLFNRDIRNFLLGTGDTAYTPGGDTQDTIVLNDFDGQFERMYWCGVEAINSDVYPQEMGCVAPLYLRKKRPNYFVIFKIDTPANTNLTSDVLDMTFDFKSDVQRRMKIIKAFDLREGTPIGDYIKRYVEQKNFEYDRSIYVNFSTDEIYYYGIDKSSGVLAQKIETFNDPLLKNDNTILKGDDWITGGFERNGLIFPYIINFEFLFDDKEIEEYKFARYFGIYCNDIDLYDLKVTGEKEGLLLAEPDSGEDEVQMSAENFYYIKDKNNNIYSIDHNYVPGIFNISGKFNINDFMGFEPTSVSAYAERVDGVGHSMMVLDVVKTLDNGAEVKIINTINNAVIGTFRATSQYGAGEFYNNAFSCNGKLADIAKGLAGAIRVCNTDAFRWLSAFNIGTKVIIKSIYPGDNLNGLFDVTYDTITQTAKKIEKVTDSFEGGTEMSGCLFKVHAEDKDMFIDKSGKDRDSVRYMKCGVGRNQSEIKAIIPYITPEKTIDEDYLLVVTDKYGPYVNVSNTNQVEIIDKFYPKIGVLSFFPVRDFDFDTVSSAYGDYTLMKHEIDKLDKEQSLPDGDSNPDNDKKYVVKDIPYGRFFNQNGDMIENEYEYYFENIIPELTVGNKTVPYIAKWGYMDEAKDSCENPYRLNTSKIFDACNFSANTYMPVGDIFEYTHSMPYYVNDPYENEDSEEEENEDLKNEYQYLVVDDSLKGGKDASVIVSNWTAYLTNPNLETDPFDKLFGDTSATKFSSKRFNKKYSRFLCGDSVNRASTLFRGVKFEIIELENQKEVHTGKYNNYRFSFIYVPSYDLKDGEGNKVYFIKNDKFKFIVGIVVFDIYNEDPKKFTKAYVYAGSMGYIILETTEEKAGSDSNQ